MTNVALRHNIHSKIYARLLASLRTRQPRTGRGLRRELFLGRNCGLSGIWWINCDIAIIIQKDVHIEVFCKFVQRWRNSSKVEKGMNWLGFQNHVLLNHVYTAPDEFCIVNAKICTFPSVSNTEDKFGTVPKFAQFRLNPSTALPALSWELRSDSCQ